MAYFVQITRIHTKLFDIPSELHPKMCGSKFGIKCLTHSNVLFYYKTLTNQKFDFITVHVYEACMFFF